MSEQQEELLDPRNARQHLFPPKYADIWQMYQIAKAAFWVPEEVDLTQDMRDWDNKLREEEREFMKKVFAFLAVFDQLVIKHLETNFVSQIAIPEVAMFYRFQEMMEDIHVHMYSRFPDTFIKDRTERQKIFNAMETVPSIKKMADWAMKTADMDFGRRVVAFVIVEGVFFSSIFAAIFFMKKQGKLPGVCHANELIARDEGHHRDFGLLLFSKIMHKPTDEHIIDMMKEAVNLVAEFNRECAPVSMIGMNNNLMNQYVKFVADSAALGSQIRVNDNTVLEIPGLLGKKIFDVDNPFPWMEMISHEGKTNFFDRNVSQYSRSSVFATPEENVVKFDSEF